MQISAASLLAAQQVRTPGPAIQATTQTAPAKQSQPESFQPLLFVEKSPGAILPLNTNEQNTSAQTKPGQVAPFVRPGSQIDIKI